MCNMAFIGVIFEFSEKITKAKSGGSFFDVGSLNGPRSLKVKDRERKNDVNEEPQIQQIKNRAKSDREWSCT